MSNLTGKKEDVLSNKIVGACIEVHRALGPGLLESTYEMCLCRELALAEIPFKKQVELPIEYKGVKLDGGYRMDIVVDGLVALEIKSVDALLPIHDAQLLTYLKLSRMKLGMLLNFNVPVMKQGIKRLVNNL